MTQATDQASPSPPSGGQAETAMPYRWIAYFLLAAIIDCVFAAIYVLCLSGFHP
jgi:hypothetical protein